MPTLELEKEVSNDKTAMESLPEIVINRDALLAELAVAAGIVETKTTIPILSNFLFVANEKGLQITATDLDRSIVTPVPAKVKKPGAVCIPARKLYDYVKLLAPGAEITLKTLDNHWVQIRSGRSNTKMVGMARANYPQVAEIGDRKTINLPVYAIKQLITQTSFAISRTESRYTLNGALLGIEAQKLTMVATDAHRMAISEKNESIAGVERLFKAGENHFKILIPARAIDDLSTMLSVTEAAEISFTFDDTNIYFIVGHRRYTSRLLAGQFPNYEAVIPRGNNNTFVVSVAEVERAVKRVATFADERSGAIKLSIGQNSLTFSATSTENGESEETVETTYDKDPIVIGFNSAYILDFLKALGGKGEIKFCMKDGQSAGLLKPEGEGLETSVVCIIMPMRV
jgi:DNA polymerase III subunit beta